MSSGSGSPHSCHRATRDDAGTRSTTTDASSTACSGSPRPGRRGAICLHAMGRGKRSPAASTGGSDADFGIVSWPRYSARQIRVATSIGSSITSMGPSSVRTNMRQGRAVIKGAGAAGARQKPRGLQHEAASACRGGRQAAHLSGHRWRAPRTECVPAAHGARCGQACRTWTAAAASEAGGR
jgi:hypothetical protein